MTSVKGTKTEKNLLSAFIGEAIARDKYSYFASKAKKEGYEEIAGYFLETADIEKEHGKRFLKHLDGDGMEIMKEVSVVAFPIASTLENLRESIRSETDESTVAYIRSAEEAEEEGFYEIADLFRRTATVEEDHAKHFTRYANLVEAGTVFKRDNKVTWRCRNCGYLVLSEQAPETCPLCKHPMAYFEIQGELL